MINYTSHNLYFHQKLEKSEKVPTPGLYCQSCEKEILDETPGDLREKILSWVSYQTPIETQDFVPNYWTPDCPHQSSILETSEIRSPSPKCNNCELESTLWICLTCGHTACGREELGGNGHAKLHSLESDHSVAVRCETLHTTGNQEVWCYKCDDMVYFQNLRDRVEFLGVHCEEPSKRAKTLNEMEQDSYQEIKVKENVSSNNFRKGILNIGNSCYLGSALQLLLKTRSIQNLLEHSDLLKRHLSTDINHCLEYECKLCQLFKLVSSFKGESESRYFSPIMFKTAWCTGSIFEGLEQQDVDEFLCYILESFSHLEKSLILELPIKIRDEFEICTLYATSCPNCKQTSFREEWQWTLHLRLPQRIFDEEASGITSSQCCTLEECIGTTFASSDERLNCQKCETTGDLVVSKSILHFPQTFFVFIQKYFWDPSSYTIRKARVEMQIGEAISQPMELFYPYFTRNILNEGDLSRLDEYQLEKNLSNEKKFSEGAKYLRSMGFSEEQSKNSLRRFDNDQFRARDFIIAHPELAAVERVNKNEKGKPVLAPSEMKYQNLGHIVHYGAHANSGHYIAFLADGDEWVEYNDEHVSKTTSCSFQDACLYAFESTA